jgi:hypothetical protein
MKDEITVDKTTTGANHPDTSFEAAERVLPVSGTQRAKVFDALSLSGLTDEEIGLVLKMNPSSVRPRRGELVNEGWVKDSGKRRKTDAGYNAIVWQITE